MSTPIDWSRWTLFKQTVDALYREGYAPAGISGGKGSALEEAERRLRASGKLVVANKTRGVLAQWLPIQRRRAARGLEHRLPDDSLYKSSVAISVVSTSRVVERCILTAAQNDTDVHKPFMTNLRALAAYYGARLHVGKFTYQVANVRERARDKNGEAARKREPRWDPSLAEFLTAERFGIGDLLVCANVNTLPTAARPLSGMHTFGQGKTAIFPHAKVALETVPVSGDLTPPCVLTTGACTVPSYSDTKAGQKGEFHHVLGAVVVETDTDGRTFFRHVIGKHDGTFQDLDLLVDNGRVRSGQRVEAITYGDTQLPFLDRDVALATWGIDSSSLERVDGVDSMIDALRPRFGFYHDLIDFKSISHHDEKKPRDRFRTFLSGGHLVEGDVQTGSRFLEATQRDFCKSVVIESNHGRWLERWLDRGYPSDRDNKLAWLRWELARMEAEHNGDPDFNILRHALIEAGGGRLEAEFVPNGGSYLICRDTGGIDCGAHGDLGPNGSHGSTTALARVMGKANVGDGHSPTIADGLYRAGISCRPRLGFNQGPSSWRPAHVVTYGATGKRALIFVERGKWRA
jgi:hypothetical protein